MMIQNYVDAMMQGDYKALSECFSKNARIFDYTLSTWNMHNYHVYGKKSIEMFFHGQFTSRILKASDAVGRKREYRKLLHVLCRTFPVCPRHH